MDNIEKHILLLYLFNDYKTYYKKQFKYNLKVYNMGLDIVIVERLGMLKLLSIKDFKLNELYKKCGFKKQEDFIEQVSWNVKYNEKTYIIKVYAKTTGRANSENKYDFPPPIDSTLFYGSCAIIAMSDDGQYVNLNVPLWNNIYQLLFGGFYDLNDDTSDDTDELIHISKDNKTKEGYLKDNFVVEDEEEEEDIGSELSEESYDYK